MNYWRHTSSDASTYGVTRFRGSKTRDRVVVWDELSRTDTGKLLRRNVVAQFAQPTA